MQSADYVMVIVLFFHDTSTTAPLPYNPPHDNMPPGHDGKLGYGGKCFPKDVNAFAKLTEGQSLGRLLAPLHELNVHFRGEEEHI